MPSRSISSTNSLPLSVSPPVTLGVCMQTSLAVCAAWRPCSHSKVSGLHPRHSSTAPVSFSRSLLSKFGWPISLSKFHVRVSIRTPIL